MELVITLVTIILGFSFGKWNEKKHIKDIISRETKLKNLPWRSTGKKEDFLNTNGLLVFGSVVIGQDAFKNLLANLSSIFGGRIAAYESLMERARREASLRMKEKAISLGAYEIVNVRMDTASVGLTKHHQASGSIEIFCYGTALIHPQTYSPTFTHK